MLRSQHPLQRKKRRRYPGRISSVIAAAVAAVPLLVNKYTIFSICYVACVFGQTIPSGDSQMIPDGDRTNDVRYRKLISDGYVPSFGTINGYDTNEGNDPICWTTAMNDTLTGNIFGSSNESSKTTTANDNLVALLNGFYDGTDQRRHIADMKRRCWSGVNFTIRGPADDNNDATTTTTTTLTTGIPYKFRIRLRLDPTSLDLIMGDDDSRREEEEGVSSPVVFHPSYAAWFRVLLCDNEKTGFCHPFSNQVDGSTIEDDDDLSNYYYVERPEYSDDDDASDNTVNLIARNHGNSSSNLFTPFVTSPLVPDYDGSINNDDGRDIHQSDLNMTITVPEGKSGDYFCIAHVRFFLSHTNTPTLLEQRVDIAGAIPNYNLLYEEPITIVKVTKSFRICFGLFLIFCLACEIYVLTSIVIHRRSNVIVMGQYNFLCLLVLCCMWVTVSCYFYIPSNDVFCNLRSTFILLPLTLVNVIIVARLWRISELLTRMITMTSIVEESASSKWLKRIFYGMACKRVEHTPQLRKVVTQMDLLRMISTLMIPQILIQIVALSVDPMSAVIVLSEDGTEGRQSCSPFSWTVLVGYGYGGFTFLLCMAVAWVSRDLPSLFNETKTIFGSTIVNTCIVLMGISIAQLTKNTPEFKPNVTVGCLAGFTLSLVLVPSWFIIIPKLRIVWSDKNITTNTLLRDGLSANKERNKRLTALQDPTTINEIGEQLRNDSIIGRRQESTRTMFLRFATGRRKSKPGSDERQQEQQQELERQEQSNADDDDDRGDSSFVINPKSSTPWELQVQILTMKVLLERIGDASLAGTEIPRKEWEKVKKEAIRLGRSFEAVTLDYDESERNGNNNNNDNNNGGDDTFEENAVGGLAMSVHQTKMKKFQSFKSVPNIFHGGSTRFAHFFSHNSMVEVETKSGS